MGLNLPFPSIKHRAPQDPRNSLRENGVVLRWRWEEWEAGWICETSIPKSHLAYPKLHVSRFGQLSKRFLRLIFTPSLELRSSTSNFLDKRQVLSWCCFKSGTKQAYLILGKQRSSWVRFSRSSFGGLISASWYSLMWSRGLKPSDGDILCWCNPSSW